MPNNTAIEFAILPLFVAAVSFDLVVLALAGALALRYRERIADDARLLATGLRAHLQQISGRTAGLLATIVAAAAALRIPLLTRPLGTDEAATVLYYSSKPLMISLSIYGSPNNHLLHTALVHLSMSIAGASEWVIRMPAFMAGLALIIVTFAAARALVGDGALIAAALVAGLPIFVDYSTDARGYTMLACFAIASVAAMLPVINEGNRAAMFLFAVMTALGFFTVPVMLYPFMMTVIWALIRSRRRGAVLIAASMALALTLLFYAPLILVSGAGALVANAYVRPMAPPAYYRALLSAPAAVWRSWWTGLPRTLQGVFALAMGLAVARRRSFAAIGGVLSLGAVLMLQRTVPFPRVWLPILVLAIIELAAAARWQRFEPAIALVLLTVTAIFTIRQPRLRETGALPHVREIARDLRPLPPGIPVAATTPSDIPLAYYLHRPEVLQPDLDARRLLVVVNAAYGNSISQTLAALRIDPKARVRLLHDYGGASVYEVVRVRPKLDESTVRSGPLLRGP